MAVGNMQAHEHRKDSGVAWLGEIPGHWDIKPGLVALSENKRDNKGMKETQVLSLSYGNIIVKPEEKLTGLVPESFETYQLVEPGDIIIRGTDLQNDQTSLRTGLAKDRGIITNAYLGLRVRTGFNSAFVHYYLHALDTCKILYKFGSGLRQNLSFEDFKRLPIVEVPTDEQNAIVRFLNEKTAKIDAAIALEERQIASLKERKQIVIQNAVTKGLNPDAPMKDSGVDWIGEIPAHWSILQLSRFSDVIDPNPSHRNPKYVSDGFPFISTQEFIDFDEIEINTPRRVSESTVLEQEARCHFQKGSIVFSRKGTIGAVRMLPEKVRLGILDSLCVINVSKKVDASFLLRSLKADYLSQQFGPIVRGAALPQMSVGAVRTLKVVVPPMIEQGEIVKHLAVATKSIDDGIKLKMQQIALFQEYKATLINSAVTGKIKVA